MTPTAGPRTVRPFPARAVRLLDGPFCDAQDADVRYVLAIDADRLCAPYVREAALPAQAEPYGSWEGDGMGGHLGGHYLSACAQLWAATGDPRVHERMMHVLDVLERCQRAVGTGYLGGVPDGRALGEELARGHVDADTFSLNGRWVPLYNLHKTLAGLLDAAVAGEQPRALEMARWFADWWRGVTEHLTDALFEEMLRTEFGAMADAFARLAELTGEPRHLAQAERFAHRGILDPLADGRDTLDGLHANTQIAKVVGYARLAALTGDRHYRDAATFFWRTVTEHRMLSFGGNSAREHFHPVDEPAAMLCERQGPESCNTVNLLTLTALLHEQTGDAALLDLYERATFNHVLSSQHPQRGGFVYFTPVRPAHYRVYSRPETSMWCCVGTGLESHARYGNHVFGQVGDDLAVQLYLAARLDWPERGVRVRLEADLVTSDTAVLHVEADEPVALGVRLRRPSWAHAMDVRVDGAPSDVEPDADHMVIRRTWHGRHTVTVHLVSAIEVDPFPGDPSWVAYRWGPVVLAARDDTDALDGLLADDHRMAHVASGPTRPLAATPVVTAAEPSAAATLRARAPLAVDLTVTCPDGTPGTVHLEPFTALHDTRYTLYWPHGADAAARRESLSAWDRSEADASEVVDEVAAGEQQPEQDHAFDGRGTRATLREGVRSRSATGWFSYTLADPDEVARTVRLTFRVPGNEPRAHDVRVGGVMLDDALVSREHDGRVEHEHELTPAMRTAGGDVVVAVHARDGLPTGELVRVRLVTG